MSETSDQRKWRAGDPEHFTGQSWIDALSESEDPNEPRVLAVQFAPGARTNWHSHAEGQVLYVLSGNGLVVNEAGQRVALGPGDTHTAPAGEQHWHGALPDSPMLHLSVTTGGGANWSDRAVDDDEYRQAVG